MTAALRRSIFDTLFLFTNGMNCHELCTAYNKFRAGSVRRKSEASSRKYLVPLSNIFFHAAYVTAFVIASYRQIYRKCNTIRALRYFFIQAGTINVFSKFKSGRKKSYQISCDNVWGQFLRRSRITHKNATFVKIKLSSLQFSNKNASKKNDAQF